MLTLFVGFVGHRAHYTRKIQLREEDTIDRPGEVEPLGRLANVIASVAGDSRNPVWFDNLMANPKASVQIGPDYVEYQARTDRQIPIVILDPLPELEQVPRSPSMAVGLE
ncbi:MAG: nitroreductase/quinone reductase family protein [Chloroflexota bacterium]